MTAGRPSEYKPEYCKQVVELGKLGYSKTRMAAALSCGKATFYKWMKDNEEFLNAVGIAMNFSQAWWEENGQKAIFGGTPGFNSNGYTFSMKNMFNDDWKDRTLLGSDPENPLPTPNLTLDASKLSNEALKELMAARERKE